MLASQWKKLTSPPEHLGPEERMLVLLVALGDDGEFHIDCGAAQRNEHGVVVFDDNTEEPQLLDHDEWDYWMPLVLPEKEEDDPGEAISIETKIEKLPMSLDGLVNRPMDRSCFIAVLLRNTNFEARGESREHAIKSLVERLNAHFQKRVFRFELHPKNENRFMIYSSDDSVWDDLMTGAISR